jgi:choline/glycine/proline betaine transport protein
VLLIPLGFTLAWLSIFGNTALDLVINQGAVELGKTALEQPSMSIYQLLEYFPASKIVIGVRCSSASCCSSPRPTPAR